MSTLLNQDFGLYGILTEPTVGYEALAEIMTDRRIRYIQLRMKATDANTVRTTALRLRKIIRKPSLLIVNDHPKIAADIGADGVHLGQDDIDYRTARHIMGEDAIIGLSTHNVAQVTAACALTPDYIGVGPVFPTPTKAIPDPDIGLDGLAEMIRRATVPAVAIGGIDHDNIQAVLQAGARNVCAVRCINRSETPEKEIDALLNAISKAGSAQ